MTLQLTPALEQRLESLATQTSQSPDELAQQAMETFIGDQEDLLRAVQEADGEFERGEIVSHEEVVSHFSKRFAKV